MPPCDKAPREDSRLSQLSRARREQLSAQQLLTRNVSKRVVDKDNHNHLRDCLKYLVVSLPRPRRRRSKCVWQPWSNGTPESLTASREKQTDPLGPPLSIKLTNSSSRTAARPRFPASPPDGSTACCPRGRPR